MASFYNILGDWRIGNLPTVGPGIAITGTVATVLLGILIRSIYYRTWHPLSRFRGPSAAATSRHWIYRVTERGFPEEELEKLHQEYREFRLIIAITPLPRAIAL